jgi:hypothetical protein
MNLVTAVAQAYAYDRRYSGRKKVDAEGKKTWQFLGYLTGSDNAGPPLWSSGQSSWLQIQRSGFDSRCYQIFSEK